MKKTLVLCFALTSCVLSQTTLPEPIEQPEEVDMANLSQLGTPSYAVLYGSLSMSGALGNIKDGNEDTYHNGTDLSVRTQNVGISWTIELPEALSVTSMSVVVLLRHSGGSNAYCHGYIDYMPYGSSSWVQSSVDIGGASTKQTKTAYPLSAVKYIKAVRLRLYSDADPDATTATLALYEMYINGEAVAPSEIKINTSSGTKTLSRDYTLSSPLRYRDAAGITRALALVATSDSNASPLRVRTSAGTKAVAWR